MLILYMLIKKNKFTMFLLLHWIIEPQPFSIKSLVLYLSVKYWKWAS